MKFVRPKILRISRIVGFSSGALWFVLASNVLAQTATGEVGLGGGTSGALPSAGSTGLTYLIFTAGVLLFVFGTLKLILSYRE